MALIEIEMLKAAFELTVRLVVNAAQAVPYPTLPPPSDDRLILTFSWQGDPLIEAGFPGFAPPPGTVLLRSSVVLTHASLAEIRLQPDTRGTSVTGTAWLLATATLNQVVLTLVGFDLGLGHFPLAVPQMLGEFPLPSPAGVGIVKAALVADGSTVTLRLATSALDNPLQPPANRLPALLAQPDAGTPNWLIHIPAAFFIEMVLDPLVSFCSSPPDGTIIEESPRAWWIQQDGAWSVWAKAGLEKIDACPGLFGDVDISTEVTVSARFVEKSDSRIDIGLTIEVNASDWDSFRCWLGSAGLGSLTFGLINPYLGMVAAIASLTGVSEYLRHEVGDATKSLSVRDFTEVSRTASTVSLAGSFPIEPLPFSSDVTFALGPTGLDIQGQIFPIAPDHLTSFIPDRGPLPGSWKGNINCSHRSMDHSFTFQALVADELRVGGRLVRGVPVTVYLTSIAEPAGKCWIQNLDSRVHFTTPDGIELDALPVPIKAPGMREGDTGFVVLHTSAGLRAYVLGPLPATPVGLPGMQSLIDNFCDRVQMPLRAIDILELRWVEPPPDYNWGHDPLRQWQIIVQGLAEDAAIEVRANTSEGPLFATGADFAASSGRGAITLVTNSETDLVLHTPNAGSEANVTLITRWLLPQHREAFAAPVRAFSKTGSMLTLHTDAGVRTFDLNRWKSDIATHVATGRTRVIDGQGQSLSLPGNRVALIHQGELVIATPVNTLTRENQSKEKLATSRQDSSPPQEYRTTDD